MQHGRQAFQVPTYLKARAAAGHALPCVEVVSSQSKEQQQGEEQAGASGKRKAVSEGGEGTDARSGEEEEAHAVLKYVMQSLGEELVTELLQGFPQTDELGTG
jgi:hypothetical protein